MSNTKAGLFFVRFSGKFEQGLVRNFELDNFEIELDAFFPELGNFSLELFEVSQNKC